jgi:hypothetical protein
MNKPTIAIMWCLSLGNVVDRVSAAEPTTNLPVAFKETILNQEELACIDRVLREMKRRHFPFEHLQLVIRSDRDYYSLLFVKDATKSDPNENDTAVAWHVYKKDHKVEGPIFQK